MTSELVAIDFMCAGPSAVMFMNELKPI